jgi:hypothetical protein
VAPVIASVCFLLFICSITSAVEKVTLASDGQTAMPIVLTRDACPTSRHMAHRLRTMLARMISMSFSPLVLMCCISTQV